METKTQINFFVFQIIAFELGVASSYNIEQEIAISIRCFNKHPLDFT